MQKIDVDLEADDIETWYNKQKTIVKFSKTKLWQQVLRIKNEVKNIEPNEFDFSEGTIIFINKSIMFLL